MHLISRSPICIIDLKIRAILALSLKLLPSVLQARNDQGQCKSKSDYPLVYFKTITKKIRRFIGEISLKMWLLRSLFTPLPSKVFHVCSPPSLTRRLNVMQYLGGGPNVLFTQNCATK